jgi:hypothetical protein
MAQMTLCERCGRTSLWRWSDAAAALALWRHTSRGWRLGCGGWLGLVWLGSLAGPAQDAAASTWALRLTYSGGYKRTKVSWLRCG